jgi:hypothetical protein
VTQDASGWADIDSDASRQKENPASTLQLLPASLQLQVPELPRMLNDAQASVYSYVTPSTVANAAKFVKALHVSGSPSLR